MINGSRRHDDLHRHSAVHRFLRRASSYHFDVVITAGFEIRLETPRNVGHAGIVVRTLQEIHQLSPERLRAVNSLSAECDATEKVLPPLMNRNDNVNFTTLLLKLVTRRIDYSIQKSFRHIKPLHQVHAFLHIGSHEGYVFLESRISLAGGAHDVFE